MNRAIKTIVLWVFVILLSVSLFIYFGDTSGNFTPGVQTLGTVNGYPIINKRVSDFSENLRSLQEIYQSQGVDTSQYSQVLVSDAFRRSVINYLVRQEADAAKISISDEDIIDAIKRDYFKNDLEEFKDFTQTGEVAVQRDIEELVRGRLLNTYLEDPLKGIVHSQSQLEEKLKVSSRQRTALVAVMSLSQAAEESITSEVLEGYFQNNISRYNTSPDVTFQGVISNVRSDYILENEENIIANIQNTISYQFQNLRSNRIDVEAFRALAISNKMFVIETGYFNFYSSALSEKSLQGRPIINDRAIIRKLFSIPVNNVSDTIIQEDFLTVVYIDKEVIEEDISDFVKRRYVEELRQENLAQILNAFYASLYNNAEIVVNQGPPQQ